MSLSVIGKHKIAVETGNLADGDSIASYLVDAAGNLLTSTTFGATQRLDVNSPSEHAEDSAHTDGDIGSFSLAVRNDTPGSLVDTDGDYAPLQVDSEGRLRVLADLTTSFDFTYAEDSAAAGGEIGAYVLAVRQDTLATDTSADGDFASFKVNASGELYTHDTDALAELVTANTSLSSILSELQSVTYAEDSASASGDPGVFTLAVRNDADTSLVSANGDYGATQIDALGRVKTVSRANVSNLQQVVAVTTTAGALPAASLANRQNLLIQNQGNSSIFIGSATVTAAGATKGIEIPKGGSMMVDAGPTNAVYAITASGSVDAGVWELS